MAPGKSTMAPGKSSYGTKEKNPTTTKQTHHHCFQNQPGPGGRTVKTGNRDENRFFKPKEPDFLLIPWTAKTGVGPLELVRTVRSNPLANLKKKKKT